MQVSLSKTSSSSSFSLLLFVLVGVCGSNILFSLCPIPRPGYCCHSVPVIPPSHLSSSTVLFQVFLCLPTVLAPSGLHPNSTIQSLDLSPRCICLIQVQHRLPFLFLSDVLIGCQPEPHVIQGQSTITPVKVNQNYPMTTYNET